MVMLHGALVIPTKFIIIVWASFRLTELDTDLILQHLRRFSKALMVFHRLMISIRIVLSIDKPLGNTPKAKNSHRFKVTDHGKPKSDRAQWNPSIS